jgi:hypothetical protein
MCEKSGIEKPIFILGINPRSGTNYVYNLLCSHPECSGIADTNLMPLREDGLNIYSNLLIRYVDDVHNYWKQYWNQSRKLPTDIQVGADSKSKLLAAIGQGLLSCLGQGIDEHKTRLVTKTPSVQGIKNIFKVFPEAYVLILVRDGRSVVESSSKSFGISYERAIQLWASAARGIVEFDIANQDSDAKYLILKYEDILENLEKELHKVFLFLDLDPLTYDYHAAKNLPVFGSSEYYDPSVDLAKEAGWKRIEKTTEFNPKMRWLSWSKQLINRFNWVAGQHMVYLGYLSDEDVSPPSTLKRILYLVLDYPWKFRNFLKNRTYSLERMFHGLSVYGRHWELFLPED